MNIQYKLDLRKADPLGLDLATAAAAAKDAYTKAADLGPGDQSRPGWYQHNQAFNALMSEARRLHGLLRIIAAMAGEKAAFRIPELHWAVTRDFNGGVRTDADMFASAFAGVVAGVGVKGEEL